MVLSELFGENARIKILEELLTYIDSFLTAEEISRMADVSSKTVYIHMNQLEEMGILEVEKKGAKMFKLNSNDERVLALGLIEANEYLRRSRKQELSFEYIDVNPTTVKQYSNHDENESLSDETPTLEFSITF
jgi:DNA-binding transcriptional ArsR family regulator